MKFESQIKEFNQWLRLRIAFYDYPELERAYHHAQRLREIFNLTDRKQAQVQLEQWILTSKQDRYKAIYSAAMSLHWHKKTILNFFEHRTTNASAESFNARIKLFRAKQKGVRDTKKLSNNKHMIGKTKSDQNFTVVIRSAGERTVDVCKELIIRDVGIENVRVIECVPFEKAIKESFKIGIESNKKWLVTVDADVLIRKNAIQDLLQIGESLPETVFQFEGMLFDGLLLNYRQGGIKIYRSVLLPKAIGLIPEPGTQIRPETYTQDAMKDHGYTRLRVDEVIGIHDFEQHYKDVFRKCFVHARKHKDQTRYLLNKWKRLVKIKTSLQCCY